MLPLGQPTCLTIPSEGMSPFQMNVTGKFGGNTDRMPRYRSDLTSSYMSPHAFAICFTELLKRLFRTFARRIL